MANVKGQGRTFRFGVFEVDELTGDLRREGKTQPRVRDQALRILIVLLERPQDLITREELRERLWAADTFVDFDHGLNTTVNQLRNALGDVATNPRFIQTLPRRGYRFIAPVAVVGAEAEKRSSGDGGRQNKENEPEEKIEHRSVILSDKQDLPVASSGLVRILFGLIQLMYLVFYVVSLARLSKVSEILAELGSPARFVLIVLIITAAAGIPTRLYLFSATAFNYRGLKDKFRKLFPVLVLDLMWAVAPFLLVHQIGFGFAIAAAAMLLYVPFSQRSLLMMQRVMVAPRGSNGRS